MKRSAVTLAIAILVGLLPGMGSPALAAPCPSGSGPAPGERAAKGPTLQELLVESGSTPEAVLGAMLDQVSAQGIAPFFSKWLQPGGDLDGDGDQDALHFDINGGGIRGVRGQDGSTMWTLSLASGVVFPMTGLRLDDDAAQDILVPEIVLRFTPPNVFEFDMLIRAVSGASGAQLWSVRYTNRYLQTAAGPVILDGAFPISVRDLNGDGVTDVLVERLHRAPAQSLQVAQFEILSGRNGVATGAFQPLIAVNTPSAPFVLAIPDANGDGFSDAVGVTFTSDDMVLTGYAGPAMAVVWGQRIPLEGRIFSWASSYGLGTDGTADVQFGFRCSSGSAVESRIAAVDGLLGLLLFDRTFPAISARLAALPDIGGSAGRDLLVSGLLPEARWASAVDGPTGATIWQKQIPGDLLPGVGDATGDAAEDLFISVAEGRQMLSGRDGSISWSRPHAEKGSEIGLTLGADLSGDARADLLLANVLPDGSVTYVTISGADGTDLGPRRAFLGGPLYARAVDLRPAVPGSDLLESFFPEDHPDTFAARPGDGGAVSWTRQP